MPHGLAGIRLGEEGSGHVEVSNAVEYLGASAVWRCFGLSLAPAAYAAVGHNLCHYPGSAAGEWAQGHGKLAAFQQSTGLDAGSTEAAPQFASVSAPAFDLRSASPASPLVDAGDLLHSALADLTGKPRDAKPDIGAYER